MPPLSQLLLNVLQLGRHALADRLSVYREVTLLVAPPTNVSEPQKVEGFWLSFSPPLPVLDGMPPELDQARLIRVEFQSKFAQPLPQLLQETLCLFSVLKPQHSVVRVAYDDHLALSHLLPPCLHPNIEHVVQIEIGKNRRNH